MPLRFGHRREDLREALSSGHGSGIGRGGDVQVTGAVATLAAVEESLLPSAGGDFEQPVGVAEHAAVLVVRVDPVAVSFGLPAEHGAEALAVEGVALR